MLQDLFNHESKVLQILKQNPTQHNWDYELQLHQIYLYHLQRERLIHLLVTLTVTLVTIAVCVTLLSHPSFLLGILSLLLICLLVPYILHYHKLENTAQRWYELAQRLESKINDV